MNGVKKRDEFGIELEYVPLNKGKRIVRLRININADDFKPGSTVAYPGPTSATKTNPKAGACA